jgi:virginiamycin A acetyltransferase
VSGEVAPYAIVAGNPARVVRRRFSEDRIAHLLAIAWWNWETERIERHIDIIVAGDVEALCRA